jgi:hypothetical protein
MPALFSTGWAHAFCRALKSDHVWQVLGHPQQHRMLEAVKAQVAGGWGSYYGETILLLCQLQCGQLPPGCSTVDLTT